MYDEMDECIRENITRRMRDLLQHTQLASTRVRLHRNLKRVLPKSS